MNNKNNSEDKTEQIFKEYETAYEPVLDFIIDIIEKNNYQQILDFGCAGGRFGFYFKKRLKDRKLIGADISKESLEACSLLYDKVYLTDGLSIPDGKFDFIIMNSVLEHIPVDAWDNIFRDISSKLKAGGVFLLQCPIGIAYFESLRIHGPGKKKDTAILA